MWTSSVVVLDFLNPYFYKDIGLENWEQRFRICAFPCRRGEDTFLPMTGEQSENAYTVHVYSILLELPCFPVWHGS